VVDDNSTIDLRQKPCQGANFGEGIVADIVKELRTGKTPIKAASGADLLELMSLAAADDRAVVEVIEAAKQTV
jgi:hypothetical protein